jgi:putative GTP pyrophosphokinase
VTESFSKTQIDRLGERLKGERYSDDDLRLLSRYCDSFADAYKEVVSVIQNRLSLEPSGREAKSHVSIIAKLKRESIRLTQIQDIAGCRLVVPDLVLQDQITQFLVGLFETVTVIDRRLHPSYGYRAVHVVVRIQGKLVEIQVRTWLQQMWAERSETFFDLDPEIKYGGGNQGIQKELVELSDEIAADELRLKHLMNASQAPEIMAEWSLLWEKYGKIFGGGVVYLQGEE